MGIQYQKSRQSYAARNLGGQGFSQEQRDQMRQQFDGAGGFQGGRNGGVRANGYAASGEIIAKDGTSITVKLPDGGSKIVYYSSTTEVGKFDQGTYDDLSVGKMVYANGTPNDDGSLTAQNIQLRPLPSTAPEN